MSAKRSTESASLIKGRQAMAAALNVSSNGLIGMEQRGLPIHKKGRGSADPNLYLLPDVLEWLVRDRERQRQQGRADLDDGADEPVVEQPMTYGTLMGMVLATHMIGPNLPKILRKFTGCSPERALDVTDLILLTFAGLYDQFLDGIDYYDGPEPKLSPMEWHDLEGRETLLGKLRGMKPESASWTLRGDKGDQS